MIIKRITLLCTFLAWATSSIAQITAFQHVVLVIQENRTPDNLFHALCATHPCSTTPGVGQYNIQTTGWLDKTAPGGKRTPTAAPFAGTYDLSHGPRGWRALCDKVDGVCKMDGAANTPCIFGTCPPHAALTYVDNTSGVLNPYLDLVGSYGWGNYFFCTQQSSSYPAHQFIFGATSADTATDDHDGSFVASSTKAANDCNNLGNVVPVIGPAGAVTKYVAPCYVRTTLSDLLETKGITWRYYGRMRLAPCRLQA